MLENMVQAAVIYGSKTLHGKWEKIKIAEIDLLRWECLITSINKVKSSVKMKHDKGKGKVRKVWDRADKCHEHMEKMDEE